MIERASFSASIRTAVLRSAIGVLLTALALTGCVGGTDPAPTGDGLRVELDTTLQPSGEPPPPLADGQARPVAHLVGEDGIGVDFVVDELIVQTEDAAALDALVARWNGRVLDSIDPAEDAEDWDLPGSHLVRIDTTLADSDRLDADLAAVAPDESGVLRVSSVEGMRLLAAAASELRAGNSVDVSFVMAPDTFEDGNSEEDPLSGGGGFRNAFNWSYLQVGGSQDIGVTDAWIALERAGRLGADVPAAVIDAGFVENDDWPANRTGRAYVGALGDENPGSCSGNPCPYHGSDAVSAMASVPDNRLASAGPGGPVVKLYYYHTGYAFWRVKKAVRQTPARIVNMSFGGNVPTLFASGFMSMLNRVGRTKLLVASAGNNSKDIDGGGNRYVPCETTQVLCVGALAYRSLDRADFSNWGDEQVQIWAPGERIVVVANPDDTGNTDRVNGTSFSAPFVAGVAALVMAADPTMHPVDVRQHLISSARDDSSDPDVTLRVDARRAVFWALGNVPLRVRIDSPSEGEVFDEGAPASFAATIQDFDDDPADFTIRWYWVDEHGTEHVLGGTDSGETLARAAPCAGTYEIFAEAMRAGGGVAGRSSVLIEATDLPRGSEPAGCGPGPDEITMDSPVDGASYASSTPISLRATIGHDMPLEDVVWRSGGPTGAVLHDGPEGLVTLPPGTHTIWVGYGTASDTATVTVIDTTNSPPQTPVISSPMDGENIIDYSTPPDARVEARGTATDPEDGALGGASLVWYYRRVGDTSWTRVADEGESSVFYLRGDVCTGYVDYQIRLVATDSAGLSSSAAITVQVRALIC